MPRHFQKLSSPAFSEEDIEECNDLFLSQAADVETFIWLPELRMNLGCWFYEIVDSSKFRKFYGMKFFELFERGWRIQTDIHAPIDFLEMFLQDESPQNETYVEDVDEKLIDHVKSKIQCEERELTEIEIKCLSSIRPKISEPAVYGIYNSPQDKNL